MTDRPKVFVVGFQKTGTTSLRLALEALGLDIKQIVGLLNRRIKPDTPDIMALSERIALAVAQDCDGLQDMPCPLLYDVLDRAFPGAKFILTVRPVEKWLQSYFGHFGNRSNPLHEWVYGVDRFEGNEDRIAKIYETQNARIRAHFEDRPDDFLEMDLGRGDGWVELVAFLGKDVPLRFPHARNSALGQQRMRQ